ncbi:hypothetical protein [Streptomyces sp. NL15-2K]|uniref:hypothetical protein n=1 Tax=Streptomyces sp. NL15-2K TaxID=376149 RepID=UPI000F579099|nr:MULTISPECIES: hypothetical protein [Actinomycetes]WKX07128.1 hypothetical protein Q4V64_06375 [Kutzneria buriramensis]GCB53389.1 hypothetical protein SNL152K_10746 [Streptomyces sp. NL15-2K]
MAFDLHSTRPQSDEHFTTSRKYAEPGTEVTVGWGGPGGLERRTRVTVTPAPCEAVHRRLGLRAAI